MIYWFSNLSVFPSMTLIIFGTVYLIAAILFLLVTRLAVGERAGIFSGAANAQRL